MCAAKLLTVATLPRQKTGRLCATIANKVLLLKREKTPILLVDTSKLQAAQTFSEHNEHRIELILNKGVSALSHDSFWVSTTSLEESEAVMDWVFWAMAGEQGDFLFSLEDESMFSTKCEAAQVEKKNPQHAEECAPEDTPKSRHKTLARIHAAAKEAGLDHAGIKSLLPVEWSFRTLEQRVLDAVVRLLGAKHIAALRDAWDAHPCAALVRLKDHMKKYLQSKELKRQRAEEMHVDAAA